MSEEEQRLFANALVQCHHWRHFIGSRLLRLQPVSSCPPFTRNAFGSAAAASISYGSNVLEQYQRAAAYVDRILRGDAGRPAGAGADQV
jgi:hypothetical protein